MPISTSDGRQYEDEFSYWHAQMFGEPNTEQPGGEGKLFLVRHGDTPMNDENLVHGWTDTPLNDKGIEQAHKAAESLKDKDITRIVSSDLPRAKQTANILAKKLDVPVTFDPNLRTWDSGDLDGTDKHAELEKYAKEGGTPPGSSESFNDFKDRIISTVSGYSANNEGHNTVLVTHSKPIKAFNAWEHAGYPEDNNIHMATYQKEGAKPGGHMPVDIPDSVYQMFGMPPAEAQESNDVTMDRIRTRGARQVAGGVIHGSRLHTVPSENQLIQSSDLQPFPEDMPGARLGFNFEHDAQYTPVMALQDEKYRNMLGGGRGEGGGGPREGMVKSESGKFIDVPNISNKVTVGVDRVITGGKSLDEVSSELALTPNQARGVDRYVKIKDFLDKDMTFDEMADKLNINRNQVASIVRRVRNMFDMPESARKFGGDLKNKKVNALKELENIALASKEYRENLAVPYDKRYMSFKEKKSTDFLPSPVKIKPSSDPLLDKLKSSLR